MADEVDFELIGLSAESYQGDAVLAKWFEQLGIGTIPVEKGSRLVKNKQSLPKSLQLNLIENPDVAQTFAVLCVMKQIPFHFTGLETLKIKETNRIAALQDELAKFGAQIVEQAPGELFWDGTFSLEKQAIPEIETYHDHRMALAFAPACQIYGPVVIHDPMVVTKSYPDFWDDLKKLGFNVNESLNKSF
jgi:3-phosphoshikimate 1-carboxyvinyltransferase